MAKTPQLHSKQSIPVSYPKLTFKPIFGSLRDTIFSLSLLYICSSSSYGSLPIGITPFENTTFSFLQTFLKTNPNQYQPTIHFKTQPNTTPKLIYNQSKSALHKVRVFPQIQTQEKSSRVCILTLNLLKLLALASSLNFLV